jgi:hypothetical protein
MTSYTYNSSRKWLLTHPTKVERYLRRNHKREDREHIADLLFNYNPDEGRQLINNYDLPNKVKELIFIDWLILEPAISLAGFGDQRQGKDVTITYLFEKCIERCIEKGVKPPRIVTLGNIKKPPFVKEKDMYFSFSDIPCGTKQQEVWIYCSEIETVIPARETISPENRLYSQLFGTFAQNKQKLFGLSKLASKVDINFLRDCNCKFFKYISIDKLNIEGIEREGILSELGRMLLPKNKDNKKEVLFYFDNNLLTIEHDMPYWYNDEYSEMYSNIPMDKIYQYIDVMKSNELDVNSIRIAIAQKFRKKLTKQEIRDYLMA